MKKTLGLFRLTVYGVGTIIGAGIYSVIGPAAAAAGDAIWLSFILAAVISAFSAVSYAELASALPSAGAEHRFMREAFPGWPAVAFLLGLFIALHSAATLATVALTFGHYLRRFVDADAVVAALVLMSVLTAVNIAGLRGASSLNVVLTTLQVGCLALLVGAAFSSAGFADALRDRVSVPHDFAAVAAGTALIFFIYTGYEHMATLAEEARRPERDVWKAFLLALAFTTTVYLAIIFAALSLLDARTLAGSSFPLAEAGSRRSAALGTAIAAAALLATANAVLSASVSASRLLFGMARDGALPRPVARTTVRRDSPWVAALTVLALAAGLVSVADLGMVASLSSLGAVLVFAAVNVAVIVLRFRQPGLARPFRVPSIGRFPLPSALGAAASVGLATQYGLRVYLIFGAGVLLGWLGYSASRRPRHENGSPGRARHRPRAAADRRRQAPGPDGPRAGPVGEAWRRFSRAALATPGLGVLLLAMRNYVMHQSANQAGSLAFSAVLAMFPLLILLSASAAFVGQPGDAAALAARVMAYAPQLVREVMQPVVDQVLAQRNRALLTIGVVTTLWTASSGVQAIRSALNRAYGIDKGLSFWRARIKVTLFTVVAGAGGLAAFSSVVIMPYVWQLLQASADAGRDTLWLHFGVRYGSAYLVLAMLYAVLYGWLPDFPQRLSTVLPGALVGAALWVAAAAALSHALGTAGKLALLYGSFAGVVATLVFLYVSAATLIFGAEINGVLREAAAASQQARAR